MISLVPPTAFRALSTAASLKVEHRRASELTLIACICVLHGYRADWAIRRCLQDLVERVGARICDDRLTGWARDKNACGERPAHRVADADVVIDADNEAGSCVSPS